MSTRIKSGLIKVILLAVFMLIMESCFLFSFAAQITAKHIDSTITIDGILDEPAWDIIDFLTFATHPAKNDLTIAKVKTLWDEQYLYVAFDILDTHVETSLEAWNDDSVTCSLKVNGILFKNRQDLRETGEGVAFRALKIKPGTTINDTSNLDAGFIVEMKISWTSLGKIPLGGDVIPIDFLSVDHDHNPGASYNAVNTTFSKISFDGDNNPDITGCSLYLEPSSISPGEKKDFPGGICDFYGEAPSLSIGDIITVKDISGASEYGSSIVKEAGKYGLLSAYGDDLATPLIEGALEEEEVSFYINDIRQPLGAIWSEGKTIKVDFNINIINIGIEAEDITSLNHSIIYDTLSGSWAGAYIVSEVSNESMHQFYIPRDGDYAIWLRISGETDLSDAVKIKVDEGADIIVGDEFDNNFTGFKWINFKNGYSNDKVILNLTQGKHVVSLKDIELDTKIDSIIITNNLGYIPPDIPPNVSIASWEQIVSDGFGDIKNHEAKMMDANGVLYVSTSNSNLHPAIYKTDDGINFQRAYELKTPYSHGYYMYRTLDLKYLDLGLNSALYAISDDWYGSCYITKLNSDGTFTTISLGRRDWWTKDIASFNGYAYAGFYNDWNLWFTMRRTQDPMTKATWLNVSEPAFGKDPVTGKQYANMDTDSSAVFKGYLYIGTYNYGYFGRITSGAQIWRTNDGTTWEQVVGNGFGSTNKRSISHMTVFGGYLYATTSEAFGPSYIYRSKDGITWELAYQGMSNEPYIGDITSYMGRLYLTTYNWGGRVYSSLDGVNWIVVSNPYINNDSKNSLIGDLHIFNSFIYVNTRNMSSGTQIWRAKVK